MATWMSSPKRARMLLDDRNQRWVPKIEAMLKEKHVFFITVGAGHLTGATGRARRCCARRV